VNAKYGQRQVFLVAELAGYSYAFVPDFSQMTLPISSKYRWTRTGIDYTRRQDIVRNWGAKYGIIKR